MHCTFKAFCLERWLCTSQWTHSALLIHPGLQAKALIHTPCLIGEGNSHSDLIYPPLIPLYTHTWTSQICLISVFSLSLCLFFCLSLSLPACLSASLSQPYGQDRRRPTYNWDLLRGFFRLKAVFPWHYSQEFAHRGMLSLCQRI